jgi:hypothetical protein
MLLEARGEEPTDLCERGAGVASGVSEKYPERAEGLDDLLGVATVRRSEEAADTAEERTHHRGKPVIHGGSNGVDTVGRHPGGSKFAEELLDACDERICRACTRNG